MTINRKNIPAHLHARYGITPPRRGLWAALSVATLTLVLYVGASVGGRLVSASEVRLITWNVTSSSAVTIDFEVFQPTTQSLVCVIRAQDSDRFDVGYALTRISNSTDRPTISVTLATRGVAFAVPTPICDVADSPALVGSHFRPGLLPPAQTDGLASPWQPLQTLR